MAESMLSVGIDIGTYTTQVIFSRLTVKNTAAPYTIPRVVIAEKKILYRGAIHLTPLKTRVLIDGEGVRRIVEGEYQKAGIRPQEVETGAVIITGESACKENAREVLAQLSGFAGDFVVSSAGPDMEGIIAGKGSGACRFSEEQALSCVNLDIGGGTTNLVYFACGEDAGTACYDIGGRLIRLDESLRMTYLAPSAARIARETGVPLAEGDRVTEEALSHVTDRMARCLEEALGLSDRTPLLKETLTAGSSEAPPPKDLKAICFSGGVSEYVYRTEGAPFLHGDIGVLLGRSIRKSRLLGAFELIRPTETIQATVVGAGSYVTELSGSTVDFSASLLPLKNIPVLKLTGEEQERLFAGDHKLITERLRWFLGQNDATLCALSFTGRASPHYEELQACAACAARALDEALPPGEPAVVVLEHDMAKALGQLLRRHFSGRRQSICLDSIRMNRGDFIDLGLPVAGGTAIPVVVKTLIFG